METMFTLNTPSKKHAIVSDNPASQYYGFLSVIRGDTAVAEGPPFNEETNEYAPASEDTWFDPNPETRDTSPIELMEGDRIVGPLTAETSGNYEGPGDFFGYTVSWVVCDVERKVNIFTPVRTTTGKVVVYRDLEAAYEAQLLLEKYEGLAPSQSLMVHNVRLRSPESYQTLLAWRVFRAAEKAAAEHVSNEAEPSTESDTSVNQ